MIFKNNKKFYIYIVKYQTLNLKRNNHRRYNYETKLMDFPGGSFFHACSFWTKAKTLYFGS